jgi:hypothetical protein
MKKGLGILLVLALVVGGAAWYFVAFKMDATIAKTIENHASASLGTLVSVGGVKSDIKAGSLSISNITIANPPGFKNKNAFSLNDIEAAIDYANFDIKRIVINNPEIVVEELGGRTNFDQIMAALNSSEQSPEPETASEGEGEGEAGKKEEAIYVIRHFRMNESRASFESESLDRYSDLKIDAIELSNIKGTRTEVGKIIASKIVSEITKEAATELLKAKASEKIGDLFGKKKD